MVEDTASGLSADAAAEVSADIGAVLSADAGAGAAGAADTPGPGSTAGAGGIADAGAGPRTTPGAHREGRRGLPRVPGAHAWPPARETPTVADSGERAGADSAVVQSEVAAPQADATTPAAAPAAAPPSATPPSATLAADPPASTVGHAMRRGLPRVHGGERWPAATAMVPQAPGVLDPSPPLAREETGPAEVVEAPVPGEAAHEAGSAGLRAAAVDPSPATADPVAVEPAVAAAPVTRAAAAEPDAARQEKPGKELSRPATLVRGGIGLLVLAVVAVLFTRWFVTLGFMQDFLVSYPGETPLPADAQPGFPAWVQWQHFFNTFLIVLIIRSGLQVRREERPSGYWTPRWSKGGNGKISLNLWFHQALDILWLLNGAVFVVLLFATGHWIRLVPTTWEVFPNALSAAIQYVSLDWPTENGWVNYNSLQMLMYFLTVFVAAPLAAISGARMSGIWPKNTKTLNRVYPVEWARAIHFPVMLYFVVFIIIHVALVFATGALRNLNHMYGGQDVVNWAGFLIFFVSLLLIVGAWIAARPLILAPIAGLFGRVSSR
ncbi:cytochrome b/b6 domain-containing protein [Arthrobacter sp. H5]|uniref:cytochrome b/b6 domain-containing protein n=1 Tax=Arthrobacter sp. H5 TaxID=1267973 RepID=UPI0004B3E7E0